MSVSIKINNREIGPDFLPLVIVEVEINHEGDFNRAKSLIDAASSANINIDEQVGPEDIVGYK